MKAILSRMFKSRSRHRALDVAARAGVLGG